MAHPHGTTGSLWPTFISDRLVSLSVRRAYAIALDERFPTSLSPPSRASVTLWEATAPVKLPAMQGPAPGSPEPVRCQEAEGWYFTDGSTRAGALASKPPTYATHPLPNTTAKL